jgi:hypothetical protein
VESLRVSALLGHHQVIIKPYTWQGIVQRKQKVKYITIHILVCTTDDGPESLKRTATQQTNNNTTVLICLL